ncbi:MAG: hypothetical protein HN337_00195 [Deltaproteobacteria bacterium]|nr:hypothetical protein [Deltaproteobacteria bacterium]
MLQKMRSLRASLSIYAKRSRFDIAHENREHYRELAMESVLDFLSHPESAACLDVDPTGGAKLSYAKNLRRRMREMMERKLLTEVQADKLVDLAKERLAVAIYRPEMILPDVVDVI